MMVATAVRDLPWPAADTIHLHWLSGLAGRSRAPLRALLGRYLGVAPDQVVMAQTGPAGKPFLPAGGGLCFNWSHSRDLALVAVACGTELGVDVEFSDRRVSARELATRYFAAEEAEFLSSLPEEHARRVFLRLWTGKEAVLKAVGCGISEGLDRVRLHLDADGELRLRALEFEAAVSESMHLQALPVPQPNLLAALAWTGHARELVHHTGSRPLAESALRDCNAIG